MRRYHTNKSQLKNKLETWNPDNFLLLIQLELYGLISATACSEQQEKMKMGHKYGGQNNPVSLKDHRYITVDLTQMYLSSGFQPLVFQGGKMLGNLICPDRVRQPSVTFPKPCCACCSEASTLHPELWASFNCTLHFHFPLASWFGEFLRLFWSENWKGPKCHA